MDKLNIHNLLITFISNNKLLFVFYVLILIIQYPIFYIYIPEYYGKVINSFKDNNTPLLNKYMGLLTLLYITKLLCSLLIQSVLYFMIPNFTEYATGSIFEFIINHYENDFENIKIGEILSKIIRMPDILFSYIDVINNDFFKYIFVFVSGLFQFMNISNDILFTYIFFVCLNYIYIFVMYNLFKNHDIKTINLQDKMYEILVDCLNNLVSIYTFNQEDYEKKRFYTESFSKYKQTLYDIKLLYLKGDVFWSVVTVSLFVSMNFLLFKAYKKKIINSEKIISLFIINFSIIGIFNNSEKCAYSLSELQGKIKDTEQFFNKMSDYNNNPKKNINKTFKNGNIEIKNVYHKYNDKFVLENINITIQKGEKVAFVGQIGSGKSTLVKLIMGFQPLVMGNITIGNVNINNVSNQELRENIFYIPQKPKLFNRTLYENIVYGLKNPPTKEEVIHILDDLKLDDLSVEFKERMDQLMGIEGNNLSGGQKQIVWLLRAFFRKTHIVILDEPTSALDPANKNKLIHVIKRLTIGKTLIIISHDHIDESFRKIQFKDGKIITSDYF